MQFETQRLILRDWHPTEDARNAMDIYSDARVTNWMDAGTKDGSIRDVQRRLQQYVDQSKRAKHGARSWAVVQKDIGRVIGTVALALLPDMAEVRKNHVVEPIEDGLPTDYMEMGWYFRRASWGYGYATEAIFCMAQYGFETLKLPLLLAVTQPDNQRSVRVMERLGMRYDGLTARSYRGDSRLLYVLTAADFCTAQAAWRSQGDLDAE